jgi:ubiquitin-protein ligase
MAIFIPPQTQKRLMRDIREATKDSLKEQGIWYAPNTSNIIHGKAMIRGPSGTPYADCLLFFSFEFPADYPFTPPKVLFLTGDGRTRMHPNLYVAGKVCLSILGTYSGPSWSANMTLETILLNLQSLLDENPLANEPAFTNGKLSDPRHKDYADAVEHQMMGCMATMFMNIDAKKEGHWEPFLEEIEGVRSELLQNYLHRCENRTESTWSNLTYGMTISSQWGRLKETFQRLSRR